MRKKKIMKGILVVIMICRVCGVLQYHIYKHGHMNANIRC